MSSVPSIVSISFKFPFVSLFLVHVFMVKCCYPFIFKSEFLKSLLEILCMWVRPCLWGSLLSTEKNLSVFRLHVWAWLIAFWNFGGKNVREGFSLQWFSSNLPFPFSVWHLTFYFLCSDSNVEFSCLIFPENILPVPWG